MNRTDMKFDFTFPLTNAKFMSAADKRRVLSAWVKFVREGFQFTHFSKALYHHLTLHCQFIAHYNRAGFYEDYFIDAESTQRFLDQFDRSKGCNSVEYGMTTWIEGGNDVARQYYDINNALVDSIAGILPEIRRQVAERALLQAQAQLTTAQAKYDSLSAGKAVSLTEGGSRGQV